MTVQERWTWVVPEVDGAAEVPSMPAAPSRYDAESWLGEHWRVLAAAGATRALLLHDGDEVGVVELRAFSWD